VRVRVTKVDQRCLAYDRRGFYERGNYRPGVAGAVYQNPISICPRHQMLTPRIIRG